MTENPTGLGFREKNGGCQPRIGIGVFTLLCRHQASFTYKETVYFMPGKLKWIKSKKTFAAKQNTA